MSGSFLILGAALTLGADVPPPVTPVPVVPHAVAAPAAPIVVGGAGCGGCGAAPAWGGYAPAYGSYSSSFGSCDPCGSQRVGLFARLKARFARNNDCAPACAPAPTCMPAPTCCAAAPVYVQPAPVYTQPAFTGFTTGCSDPCQREGLLARLRAKFKRSSDCCDAWSAPACGSGCGPVASGYPVGGGCTAGYGTVLPGTTVAPGTPQTMPAPTDPKKEDPKKDPPKELSLQPTSGPTVPVLGGTSGKY